MKRSTFMSRGKGFKRPERMRTPRPPLVPIPENQRRSASYASISESGGPAQPKTTPHRNRHLLDMARGKPCLLQDPVHCKGGTDTTVACHSNLAIHGKAKSRKANDEYSVWGCSGCHFALDQGWATRAEKEARFMAAHLRQVLAWREIVADYRSSVADRWAAQWALDHLNATSVGELL